MLYGMFQRKMLQRRNTVWNLLLLSLITGAGAACGNILLQFGQLMSSDIWEDIKKDVMLQDQFFGEKTDVMVSLVSVMFLLILLFCVTVLFLKTLFHLNRIKKEVFIYRLLGYSGRRIFGAVLCEAYIDVIFSIPVAYLMAMIFWELIEQNEMMNKMMELYKEQKQFSFVVFILCIVAAVITISGATWYYYGRKAGTCIAQRAE